MNEAIKTYEFLRNKIGASNRKLYLLTVNRLAFLYAMRGEMEKTLDLLQEGIAVDPENPHFYYETAALYGSLSQVEESVKWLDKALKRGYNNWEQLQKDQRLGSIRNTHYFKSLRRRQ